jgi:hypothetical protein
LRRQNKTLIAVGDKKAVGAGSKTAFRKGAESSFCLWQELKSTNEKIAENGDRSEFLLKMAHLYEFARTHFSSKSEN